MLENVILFDSVWISFETMLHAQFDQENMENVLKLFFCRKSTSFDLWLHCVRQNCNLIDVILGDSILNDIWRGVDFFSTCFELVTLIVMFFDYKYQGFKLEQFFASITPWISLKSLHSWNSTIFFVLSHTFTVFRLSMIYLQNVIHLIFFLSSKA